MNNGGYVNLWSRILGSWLEYMPLLSLKNEMGLGGTNPILAYEAEWGYLK